MSNKFVFYEMWYTRKRSIIKVYKQLYILSNNENKIRCVRYRLYIHRVIANVLQ